MNLEQQQKIIELGRNAEALKQNPALEACMNQTLEDLFFKWVSTNADESLERDQLWAIAQALKAFKDTLDTFIEAGDFERKFNKEDN